MTMLELHPPMASRSRALAGLLIAILAVALQASPASACPPVTPPPGALPESEACGALANDGCNGNPHRFGAIACGQTVSGTAYSYEVEDLVYRDTDWFAFTTDAPKKVTVMLTADFNAVLGIPEFDTTGTLDCTGNHGRFLAAAGVRACVPGTLVAELPNPGTYALWIGQRFTDHNLTCPLEGHYALALECVDIKVEPSPTPTPFPFLATFTIEGGFGGLTRELTVEVTLRNSGATTAAVVLYAVAELAGTFYSLPSLAEGIAPLVALDGGIPGFLPSPLRVTLLEAVIAGAVSPPVTLNLYSAMVDAATGELRGSLSQDGVVVN